MKTLCAGALLLLALVVGPDAFHWCRARLLQTPGMPPHYYLMTNKEGKWTYNDGSMVLGQSWSEFDSRTQAVAAAWRFHDMVEHNRNNKFTPAP